MFIADAHNAGERTPVGVRLSLPPASIPEHWIMCKTARQFRAAVSGSLPTAEVLTHDDNFLQTRKLVERKDGTVEEGEWYMLHIILFNRTSFSSVIHKFAGRADRYRSAGVFLSTAS
jgi:hypothetical protein